MPKIVIPAFKGTLPAISPKNLPEGYGQTADNVDLNADTLAPFADYDSTLALTGTDLRKAYKIKEHSVGDSFWITSTTFIDICLSPSTWLSTEYARFYWTDGVVPKKSNFDMASVSGANTNGSVDESYFAGVPAPPSALTATVVDVAADGVIHASVNYVYTYVTAWGEESMPSAPSNTVDVEGGEYVQLSGFTFNVAALTRRGIVGVRVYRVNTGATGNAEYQIISDLNDSTDGTYKKAMGWNDGTGTISVTGTAIEGVGTNFSPDQLAVNNWMLCKGQWFKIATLTDDDTAVATAAASPNISAGATFQYDTQPWTTINDKQAAANEIYDDADLGDIIESEEWDEPEDDLQGFILLANSCMAAFKHNEVWISEPGYPFTFPYKVPLMSDVVGLGYSGTTIIAFTKTRPCVIEAYDPNNLSVTYIPEDQVPLWRRTITSGNGFVLAVTPDGVISINTSNPMAGFSNITEKIFTKKQWQALLTTTTAYDKELIACLYDNKYYVFFLGTENGFLIDLVTMDYRTFSLSDTVDVYDTFVDAETDSLYLLADVDMSSYLTLSGASSVHLLLTADTDGPALLVDDNTLPYIIKWDGHATDKLTYTWKSRKYYYPKKVKFNVGMISLTTGDSVTVKVYADGTQVGGDLTVSSSAPFRFGASGTVNRPANVWEFLITGTKEVQPPAVFATTMDELMS